MHRRPPVSAIIFIGFLLAACGDPGTGLGPDGGGGTGTGTGADGGDPGDPDPDAGGDGDPAADAAPAACGDGVVHEGDEVCDDGNTSTGDGCSADCQSVEDGWICNDPGEPCVQVFVCGNGILEDDEACDDHDRDPGDGCDADCNLESGWTCELPGLECEAAECGDGIVAGFETCDDGDDQGGDGCDAGCRLEDGHACDTPGEDCRETDCGDGVAEGTEECDDGNTDLGDGCNHLCLREPSCTDGTCQPFCGDGVRLGGEACDDGNLRDGDGCSADCTTEDGFTCNDVVGEPPEEVFVPIVYRDFRGFDLENGHPDFENNNTSDKGIVETQLGADGKPVYAGDPSTPSTTDREHFDQWYRDTPGVNMTVTDELRLVQQDNPGEYVFETPTFFPLDERGFVLAEEESLREDHEENLRNFHFTSELRYWFEYEGDEELVFLGDDDVFVFINEKLAIDLGGQHSAQTDSITLDAQAATDFGLEVGGIYEAVVFQAERHTTRSEYRLTLHNFETRLSACDSECGDGVRTPDEVCDDGTNDGGYGSCTADCKGFGPRCGDGEIQPEEEACDNGLNTGEYDGCLPTCELGPYCGDGEVQRDHETCDDGNNDDGDGCPSDCQRIIIE